MSAVTIKDIAKKLNISVSTVSYALNGGPRRVPVEVKERVLQVARELNYRPNRVARSMITGRSHTIGIVPPEMGTNIFLGPYIRHALNGIANEAGDLHQDILVFTRYKDTTGEEMLSVLLDGRVDGVVFMAPHTTHRSIELSASRHLPCVAISGTPVEGMVTYTTDNAHGVRLALEHLYELGHRKIAHIAGQLDMQDAIVRLQAYQHFLHDKGLPYRDEWVVKGRFVTEGGLAATYELLDMKERPTAIFCSNDEMAVGAVLACRERGLSVPEEMSIAGFDDAPGTQFVYPALTTVRQPIGDIGSAAVRALIQMIEGRQPEEHPPFTTELVVRDSTSCPKEDII